MKYYLLEAYTYDKWFEAVLEHSNFKEIVKSSFNNI